MTKAELIRVPALDDNYIWMLHDPSSNALAVIDPGDATAVINALEARGLTPQKLSTRTTTPIIPPVTES